jgi:hypothetical protein
MTGDFYRQTSLDFDFAELDKDVHLIVRSLLFPNLSLISFFPGIFDNASSAQTDNKFFVTATDLCFYFD